MQPRADVTAACCVAATMLMTGLVPSDGAVAAAHDALVEGWARRARRLPSTTAADTIARLAPLRERVRVADLIDALRDADDVPAPVFDAQGRSLHSFRHVAAVVDRLFTSERPRALLWETRPAVLMAALASGVWAARAQEEGGMCFERVDGASDAIAFMRRFHTEDAAAAPCNVIELA